MYRLPVASLNFQQKAWVRAQSSSSFIRNTFVEYFVDKHNHKHVKPSSVVPLYDSSVPFVNAGMNQFKGVFLGMVDPPCPRAVNSQKCIRVGGKHNDLAVVGEDEHHHTFFEMLGNWSFGDYHKKEACQMAWDLLLGPYRLKPENLAVTYFAGDYVMDLTEDRECRDIWLDIGVPKERVVGKNASENFWEMGASGPCGPCTEIHYVLPDGSWTELWNIVFISCKREENGKVRGLGKLHVDTGMGLERAAAILQAVPSNYDTDLFVPLIRAIQKNSKGVDPYNGRYGPSASLDSAYRKLADHARMISVCLADGVFPATNLNLKQIIRKSIKISTDVFKNPNLLPILYDQVVQTIGSAFPELNAKEKDAKLILGTELESYSKLKSSLSKRWKDLVKQYPEVEAFSDVEMTGFAQGYRDFKEGIAKINSNTIPGELVFKLYDTHGFQEDLIQRIAKFNNYEIDTVGFWKLLKEHKAKHKTALKEQADDKGTLFENAIETLKEKDYTSTDDRPKYEYNMEYDKLSFPTLKTKLICILNSDITWLDVIEPLPGRPYYLVTEKTNFYCEEGGQISDSGEMKLIDGVTFSVKSVFKIRDFVFHKGFFDVHPDCEKPYIRTGRPVELVLDTDKRLRIMKNHTAIHLLNAAIRKVLKKSVVCQIGSSVTDYGFSLNLSLYGEKLSNEVILEAQHLVRKSIEADVRLNTKIVDSKQLSEEKDVLTVPGEVYPSTGIRLVSIRGPLPSRELCCGTHVPRSGDIGDVVVTTVRGAGGNSPQIHALTDYHAKLVRELFCRAEKLSQVIDLINPTRKAEEISSIRTQLEELCGTSGAPYGEYQRCLAFLDNLLKRKPSTDEIALQSIAEEEIRSAIKDASENGRRFVVHFLRCSYLMQSAALPAVLRAEARAPSLVIGCAGGTIVAGASVPEELVSESFTAEKWLSCVLPVFDSCLQHTEQPHTYAQMTATKVSLITCEQLVQDAMRVAIKYAQAHSHAWDSHQPTEDRRHN